MSSGLDMSLDDLIKQSKSRPKASTASSSGPTRRAPPAARAAPYPPTASKAAASPYGVYSEHVAAMAASAPPPAAPRALETRTKLYISNLDASVTVEDVQELFSEVGELKRYSVNYDKDGRSKGTAEVVFARKVDALDATKRYNGVLLDGKATKIELIGNNAEPPPTAPLMYDRAFPNYNAIPNRLFQQWAVDMYIKIESMRLDWYSNPDNQKLIRAELYQGLVDVISTGETRASEVGKRIVLPRTFPGGDRDMMQKFLNAMAIVQRFGKPDYFISMTCNPY